MESKSTSNLINNNLLKKINFEKSSNICSYTKLVLLWYVLFIKICALIYFIINLKYVFKRQKNDNKIIISLIKKYLSNEKSIISAHNTNMESEIYLDKYETHMIWLLL